MKIFILIPVLSLVLTACDHPQPPIKTSGSNQSDKEKNGHDAL
jgi:hypothetical protein